MPSFIVGFTPVRVPAGGVHWDSLQHHLKWDNKHVTAITPCSLSLQRVRFILQGAQLPLLVAFEAECTSCHEGKDCLLFRTRRAIPHTTAMPQTQVGVRAVQCRGKRQANCSLTKRLQELCRLCKPISLSESVMIFNRSVEARPRDQPPCILPSSSQIPAVLCTDPPLLSKEPPDQNSSLLAKSWVPKLVIQALSCLIS